MIRTGIDKNIPRTIGAAIKKRHESDNPPGESSYGERQQRRLVREGEIALGYKPRNCK
ncbi:MAG: hypothetical protein ACXW6K_20980 [Candidatus Binatia bacterium]